MAISFLFGMYSAIPLTTLFGLFHSLLCCVGIWLRLFRIPLGKAALNL